MPFAIARPAAAEVRDTLLPPNQAIAAICRPSKVRTSIPYSRTGQDTRWVEFTERLRENDKDFRPAETIARAQTGEPAT